MGSQRQQESLSALGLLGLSPDQVVFLSYPDRGTPALWNTHWASSNPYNSPYVGATSSPYPVTYNPQANYSGESYLADLVSIISEYQPDLIIYPDPEDVHPDHWGLSVFTRAAIAQVEQEHPGYQPAAYSYLVHRPDFPRPKGLFPDQSLLPPLRIYAVNPGWFRLDLPLVDETLKGRAVLEYRSQLPWLYTLLASFIRKNELFTQPKPVVISTLAQGSWKDPQTWRDSAGLPIQPVQRDPERDFLSRSCLARRRYCCPLRSQAGRWQPGLYACRCAAGSSPPWFTRCDSRPLAPRECTNLWRGSEAGRERMERRLLLRANMPARRRS